MPYPDGRPAATLRLPAYDQGVIIHYGGAPGGFDATCCREAIINQENCVYYLFYDGASNKGWVVCLAVSTDLVHWEKRGPLFPIGQRGEIDRYAVSPWVVRQGDRWHMFYIGADGDVMTEFPYLAFKATSKSLAGPWVKQPEVIPFRTMPDTYYSVTASAGHILWHDGEYLMFFSATTQRPGHPYILRTLGIARTKNLDGAWTVDPSPILPIDEQIENTSLYYEPACQQWFMFTNHIGVEPGVDEYTDAAWVYWSADLNHWDPRNKAVVLDGNNCTWSKRCIGMPTVIKVGDRLAVFYDAPGGDSTSHFYRQIGLAWLDLPLSVPRQ
jgi:predicted GH43/DUF377 family glycosyl hydrolase